MSEKKHEHSLVSTLDQYFTAPMPGDHFIAALEQRILSSEENPVKIRRGKIGNIPQPAFLLFTASVVLIVAFLVIGPTKVRAAIENWLRYVPGFGLVDQESAIRTLAEPVSQTRDGVTLTIKQAVLSTSRTGLVFTLKGLSPQAVAGESIEAQKKACHAAPILVLPDGDQLHSIGNGSNGYDAEGAYQVMVFYPPLSGEIEQATFVLPCIPGTIPGKAPENWELPVRFVSGPIDGAVTQLKVKQVPTNTPSQDSPPVILDQVIETNDGFIFLGRFQPLFPNSRVAEVSQGYVPSIRDAAGKAVSYRIPDDLLTDQHDSGSFFWAYEIQAKDIAWPVTIQFETVGIACFDDQAAFTLNAGANPGDGQVWDIGQELTAGACSIKVISVKRNHDGYSFLITGLKHPLRHLNLEIAGFPASRYSIRDYPSYTEFRLVYDHEVPENEMNIVVSGVIIDVSGPWEISWQPGDKTR